MPSGPAEPLEPGGFRRRWRSRRFVVGDESMRPAFLPGDRVYVDPRPGRPIVPGDVVVARDPERPGRFLLKRVVAVAGGPAGPRGSSPAGHLDLEGDNAAASRDSRQFGSVPASSVVGVVWFRYLPLARRGPSPGRNLN